MPSDHYLKFIENVVTPRRLLHSQGVMQVMGELAEVYKLDKQKAEIIGILHDAGKDLPPDLQKQLVEAGKIQIRYECENDYLYYLHGPVGSYFVQKELGISDRLILDAITTHTYCGDTENFNHPLCWCLRFGDILEPSRDWSKWGWLPIGVENLRSMVYAGRMQAGAFLHMSMLIKWFDERNVPVHPHMRQATQELSVSLKLDSTFLAQHISTVRTGYEY